MLNEIYIFSKKYSPPKTTLKDAEIMSEWGETQLEDREVDHSDPGNVSREEIEFYTMVYSFLEFEDFLFYLYPMAREFEKDKDFDNMEFFITSFDSVLNKNLKKLNEEDHQTLKRALLWLSELHPIEYSGIDETLNIQKFIGYL